MPKIAKLMGNETVINSHRSVRALPSLRVGLFCVALQNDRREAGL